MNNSHLSRGTASRSGLGIVGMHLLFESQLLAGMTDSVAGRVQWVPIMTGLAISGAVGGTLMDGIHSRVPLQVYDVLAFSAGGLNSSLVVPPVLSALYMTMGLLIILSDRALSNDSRTLDAAKRATPQAVVASLATSIARLWRCSNAFRTLSLLTLTSAQLFAAEVPSPAIGAILAVLTVINWRVFDRTINGALLAVLLGLGAPLTEVVLNSLLNLWHYPREDLPGMVSWVPWCYAFYVPYLTTLSRYLWKSTSEDLSIFDEKN